MTLNEWIEDEGLQPGDAFIVKKLLFNMRDHYVLFMGFDEYGFPEFYISTIKGIERLDFHTQTDQLQQMIPIGATYVKGSRDEAIKRAREKIENHQPDEFSVTHFAKWVQTGKEIAKRDRMYTVAALALLAWLASGVEEE